MRLAGLSLGASLSLMACGGAQRQAEPSPAPVGAEAAPVSPKDAAEAAAARALAEALARQKPAFDAALAGGDTARLEALAGEGNGWALYWRAQERLSSQDISGQQGGFSDMEAAAERGVAEAQMWVGMKMAYGLDGYPLKPASGLKMMEHAARQGNVDAILAVAQMYAEDTFMSDRVKAREWFERAAGMGSQKAREALARMDGAGPERAP